MSVPALHPLLVHHADNQLSSGAFSRFRQLGGTTTTTTTAPNQTNLNILPTQTNPASTLTFGQQNGPTTTTILTGPAALAAHQQITQQAQRNRMFYKFFFCNNSNLMFFLLKVQLEHYLFQVVQLPLVVQHLVVLLNIFNMSINLMLIH